jgi:hypothetical protein
MDMNCEAGEFALDFGCRKMIFADGPLLRGGRPKCVGA